MYALHLTVKRRLTGDERRTVEIRINGELQRELRLVTAQSLNAPNMKVADAVAATGVARSPERVERHPGSVFAGDEAGTRELWVVLEDYGVLQALGDRSDELARFRRAMRDAEDRYRRLTESPPYLAVVDELQRRLAGTQESPELQGPLDVAREFGSSSGAAWRVSEPWTEGEVEPVLTELERCTQSTRVVRRLFRDLRLSRYDRVGLERSRRFLETLRVEAGDLQIMVREVTNHAVDLTAALRRRDRGIRDAATALRRQVETDVTIARSTETRIETETAHVASVRPGIGLGALPMYGCEDVDCVRVVPHATIHRRLFWSVSIDAGLTLSSLAVDGVKENLFWFTNVILGANVGVRKWRVGGGVVLLQNVQSDGSERNGANGYVALSFTPF